MDHSTPSDAPKLVTVLRPAVASSSSASIARPSRPPGSTTAPVAQPPSKPPASTPAQVPTTTQPPTTQAPTTQPPTSQPTTQPPAAQPPAAQPPTSQPPASQPQPIPAPTQPQPIPTPTQPQPIPAPATQPPAVQPPTAQAPTQPPAQPNGHSHSGPPSAHSNPPSSHSGPPSSQSHSGPPTESELDEESETYSELEQNPDGSEIDFDEELNQDEPDASQVKKVWAIVKFVYDTSDPEELALQPDEVIEIVQQTDDGWWKGKNVFGKEGIFPHNFVVITDDPSTAVRASPVMQASPLSPSLLDFAPSPSSGSSSPALSLKAARRSIFQKKKSKDDDLHGSSPSPTPFMSSSSGLPGSRKNSGDKPKKDRRSQTLQGNNSTPPKGTGSKIVTSPSMPSLHSFANKATRSPSQSNLNYDPSPRSYGLQHSASANFSGTTPPTSTPTSPTSASGAYSPFSSSASLLPAYNPAPASPSPSPTTSSPLQASPEPSPRGGTNSNSIVSPGDSFIMKVHIPPSGSSQFKVSPNQTVGDLIAMVAKKRVYNVKDCSMRLPNAPHYEPPIDPSKPISHINTRELRLFLEGESAASLPPIPSQPIHTPAPTPTSISYTQFPQSSGIANGRSIKEGYINKADHNKKMKKVWVTLDKNYVYFYKTALDKNPTERISLYCATPKLNTEPKKKNYFDLLTVTNTYSFAADSEYEASAWVSVLHEMCQALLMKQIGGDPNAPAPSPAPAANKASKAGGPQHTKDLVLQIRDLPENNTCAECGAPNPEWAAINLGIFFCIDCSGIHRSMGVHISQVRSVVLDHWDMSQVMIMENMGNKRANEFWEHTIPPQFTKPTPKSTIEEREEWIRAKYQQKQFIELTFPQRAAQPASNPASQPPTPESSTTPNPSPRSITPPLTNLSLDESKSNTAPTSTPAATSAPTSAPTDASTGASTQAQQGPQRIPGLDFVGYGFFANLDDPSRPSLRRQMRLFKNSFDENRSVHVAINNAPAGTWRDVEYLVVDHYSVDTSSVRGYVPAATKVFDKHEDYLKFLSTHTHPQLDNYRQTLSLQGGDSSGSSADTPKWYVVTELRMELYELFVDQIDDEGLSTHVTKAAPVLAQGDPALLAQFIKKNGTHFVRSGVYGGRTLLKTLVDKTVVPDKDEAARLCHLNFKTLFEGETHPGEDLKKVQNYTMDITGGDNRKRGLEWVQSIWDRPQVLSYDMELISQVFDDLSLSVKIEAAANEYIEKIKS